MARPQVDQQFNNTLLSNCQFDGPLLSISHIGRRGRIATWSRWPIVMPLAEGILSRAIHRPTTVLSSYRVYSPLEAGLQWHRRSFHASPRNLIVAECLSTTHTLITGIHNVTGLPWVATLPLTAALIRLTITGPIATYGKIISQRRIKIFPLLYAWRAAISRNVFRTHKAEGPVACEKIIAKAARKKGAEVRKNLGVQYWKSSLTWIQLPIFLVVIDTIRGMCGYEKGLLGLLTSAAEGEDVVPEENLGQTLDDPYFEPTLALEGALWFPDLLVPDPMLILPFTLSASLFAIIYGIERRSKSLGVPIQKWQLRFQQAMKIFALLIGPATIGVPSGILVYWISSTWFGICQNALLDWYFPTKPAVGPLKPKRFAKSPTNSG